MASPQEPSRWKFDISGTGAQRRCMRVAPGPNAFVRYAFLRVVTATAATGSLYMLVDTPKNTSGTLLGGTTDFGVVTDGMDPATIPQDHGCYAKTGVAMTASTTNAAINEAVTTNVVASGVRVVMIDMTAATGAWQVIGFFVASQGAG